MFERDPSSGAERHPTAFVSYWAGWAAEVALSAARSSVVSPATCRRAPGLMTGRDPDNWMTRIDGHQGVAVLRNRVLSVVPYTAGVVTFDTKRRVWENRVTLDAGVKVVRPFVGGVVEAGVAERRQYTVLTDEVQTAPVVYVSLWVGWNPRTVSRR